MIISPGLIIILFILALVVILLAKGLMIVQQSEAVVIERLGSYSRTLESGVNLVIPFIDKPRSITIRRYREVKGDNLPLVVEETRIDRRETVMDFPGQSVVTTDNVTVTVNGALYFQIVDPKRAVYEVENFTQAVEVLAKTSLRSEIGRMELDKLFESRKEVNDALQITMDEVGDKWGVKVTRVEIQDISMPEEVEDAIATAEGEKQSSVLRAEGDKQAAILRAEGERQAIYQLRDAIGAEDPQLVVGYMLGQKYLQVLPDMAREGDRVFIPYEASALLGAMGSFRELATEVGEPTNASNEGLRRARQMMTGEAGLG